MFANRTSTMVRERRRRLIVLNRDAAFGARLSQLAEYLALDTTISAEPERVFAEIRASQEPFLLFACADTLRSELLENFSVLNASRNVQIVFVAGPGTDDRHLATLLGEARRLPVLDIIYKPASHRDLYDLLQCGTHVDDHAQLRHCGA